MHLRSRAQGYLSSSRVKPQLYIWLSYLKTSNLAPYPNSLSGQNGEIHGQQDENGLRKMFMTSCERCRMTLSSTRSQNPICRGMHT